MSYKVAPLTVNPKRKSSYQSKAFVSQPSAEEELLVGRLFVLMEIDQSRADDFALADFIVKEIYHHYYENEQFFLRDKIANLKIDYVFEAAITKLNRGIAEFLETQKIAFRPGGITIVIGVLHKNQLLFTSLGTSKTLLFYRPKLKNNLFGDYNLLDISEKTEDPTQEITHQTKVFANVINGTVPPAGYFLFANEALLEYISKKQLTDIITTLPPASAAEQIKLLLEQTNAFVAFFALIIKNTVGEERAFEKFSALPAQTPMGGGRVSVDQFNTTQERTEELLTPSGVLTIKKWLAKLQPTSSVLKNYAEKTARTINTSAHRLKNSKETRAMGQKVLDLGKVSVALLIDVGRGLKNLITNRQTRASVITAIKNSGHTLLTKLRHLITHLHGLKRKQKILLSLGAVAIVILIINIAYSGAQARREAEAARLTEAKTAFEQKEHQLEASLLYNNREGAKQILNDMEAIITDLPTKTEAEQAAVTALTNQYHSHLDSIFAIQRIVNPASFIELPNAASSLIMTEGELFAASNQAKTIYKVATDKTVTPITNDAVSGDNLRLINEGADIYLWDQKNIFTASSLQNSLSLMTINNQPNGTIIPAVYNDRLYLLSENDKSIYRFNQDKRNLTFSGRQTWTRQPLTERNFSAMAINGRIFVIADQNLIRLSNGTKDTMLFEETTPTLEDPTLLVASSDQSTIYVLEPKHNRVIAYSSDGAYLAQYTSDTFNTLSGLAVNEDNTKLYLLNDKTVYEIEVKK